MPIAFEEALKRLQQAEGLNRGAAVDRLFEAHSAGDPELSNVSDLNSSLVGERARSIAERAGVGVFEGAETPIGEILQAPGRLFGQPAQPTYGEQAAEHVRSQTATTPYAEGVGEIAGSALPFTGIEKAASLIPLIGKIGIARQIIAGGVLERADTGQNTVLGSVVAPVALPWAVEKAAGLIASGARSLFGRGADVIPEAESGEIKVDPKAVIGMTNAPETPSLLLLPPSETTYGEGFTMKPSPIPEVPPEPVEPGVPTPTPETNLEAAHRTIVGPRGGPSETSTTLDAAQRTMVPQGEAEAKPGFTKTAEDLLAEHEKESQVYVGTANLRTGQPFEGTRTSLLSTDRGRVFVNADHPSAKLGTPTSIKVANPAVINVHENPYRDALEQVFGDNKQGAQVLDTFDKLTGDVQSTFARELLGRWSKFGQGNKFDSLVLRSPDPKNDIIIDYKTFMPGRHPYLVKGMSTNLVVPKQGVFAKKLFDPEDLVDKASRRILGYEPVPNLGAGQVDPFTERRAMKYEGKIYPAKTADLWHSMIREDNNIPFDGGESGFIGHDGKFYTRDQMEQKSSGYIRRYGHPKPGEKVNFSDLGGGFAKRVGTETSQDDVKSYGFDSPQHLARAIRASRATPFELFASESRWPGYRAPLPEMQTGAGESISLDDIRRANPEYADALQALANRRPRLMNLLSRIKIGKLGDMYTRQGTTAMTRMAPDGSIEMIINTDMWHTSPVVQRSFFGKNIKDPREFYATTLEHELTHVAQFWADVRGFRKTLGTPNMWDTSDTSVTGPVERQAYARDEMLTKFFDEHRQLQQHVASIPDDVKAAALKADIVNQQRIMRPMLARKFNKLKGEPSVKVWAKKVPGFDPEDINGYDSDSRSLFDSQFDPDNLISPEVKDLLARMNQYGLKWFAAWRRPQGVSDHPLHLSFISRIFDLARDREVKIDGFNRTAGTILKDYGANDTNYDKLFEAVEGLRRAPDGTLTQTVANLDAKTAAAAIKLRETVMDPLYEHVTGIDRRAPAILKGLSLPDTDKQWTRIKLLQQGLTNKVPKPLANEIAAAQQTQGMLNFNEGHDIRGGFVDGYLTHQPIKNERATLIDQVRQLQALKSDPATQAELIKKIKRLEEIETSMVQQRIKGLPARDVVPSKHFFGPINVRNTPGAAEVLVDKNIPHIMGRYINGVVSKRFFDQALHEFRLVADDLPPSVRDYDTNYLNNLRGVRGYREDIGLVNAINSFNEKVGIGKRVNLNDVRGATHFAMQLNNYMKLFLNQVRFPIIQASHVLLTDGVVDPRATIKGLAYVLAKPKQAMLEAMGKGIIERDAEFLGAMDEVSPSTQGQMLKYATAMSKYSDYFRKAVTYHGFRLRALEPGFKPSSVIRTFIKDVAGRNAIQMSRDYGAAATDILQFRLRAEGKPQAFVGGVGRRLWGQFKQWPINIGGLYGDVIKSGDKKMIGRLLGTLWFFGGMSFGGGEMLYNRVRTEMLKRGHILPEQTGWQIIANQMGIGESLQNVNILSLKDPIGVPRSIQDIPSWIAGPTFGSMYDYATTLARDDTTPGQATKATISGISPQLRAGVDAWEEMKHGGVVDPSGRVLAMREPAAVVIRGLDLSPSVRTQRYQVKNDIITALEAGQRDTAMQLLSEARKKGLVFGPKDLQEIKGKVRATLKQRAIVGGSYESLVR